MTERRPALQVLEPMAPEAGDCQHAVDMHGSYARGLSVASGTEDRRIPVAPEDELEPAHGRRHTLLLPVSERQSLSHRPVFLENGRHGQSSGWSSASPRDLRVPARRAESHDGARDRHWRRSSRLVNPRARQQDNIRRAALGGAQGSSRPPRTGAVPHRHNASIHRMVDPFASRRTPKRCRSDTGRSVGDLRGVGPPGSGTSRALGNSVRSARKYSAFLYAHLVRRRDPPFRGLSLRATVGFVALYLVASLGLELARRLVRRRLNLPGWTVDLLAFGLPVVLLATMLAIASWQWQRWGRHRARHLRSDVK